MLRDAGLEGNLEGIFPFDFLALKGRIPIAQGRPIILNANQELKKPVSVHHSQLRDGTKTPGLRGVLNAV
jgi:hypothetical protein